MATGKVKTEPVSKECGSGKIKVMLAQNYNPDVHDPTGWYMSEKLDGVRCYWNGKRLYSRNGNVFFAPAWWKAKLPKIALDGELWSTRDAFQKIVSIVKKKNGIDDEWKHIKYHVFDAPLIKAPFKDRIEALKQKLPNDKDAIV